MDNPCRILSLNVRGLNELKKRRSVFNWIQRQKTDIAFLQETYSSQEKEDMWQNEWGGKIIFLHGSKHSRGNAILINKKLKYEILQIVSDPSSRIQMAKINFDDLNTIWLVNIYAPNTDQSRVQLFKTLSNLLSKNLSENDEVIIGGDFNVTLDETLDKKGGNKETNLRSRNELKQLIDKYYLNDIWRTKNPEKKRFTWRQHKPEVQCRLDFFLISNSLQDNTSNIDILPAFRSDHSGVLIEINPHKVEKRGRGYWKFNANLLTNNQYTQGLIENIQTWKAEMTNTDSRIMWEWLKFKIREYTVHFSKQIARQKKDQLNQLTKELKDLEDELATNNDTYLQYTIKKKELENMMDEKTEGMLIRAKVKWFQEGEKSTKYFYSLEKRNYNKKTIRKLNIDGVITENPKHILEEQKSFYKDLYTSKETHENIQHKFLYSPTLPKLKDEEKNECEGKLTNPECFKALKSFENGKSPGNDGLTTEFYLHFWPYLGDEMVQSFNMSYDKGELTTTQRQAVITLLEKPGKDRTLIKNWRPISLLNTDYKIASKALAKRLTPLLPNIIHSDQTGYVRNRNITDSIRSILDILEFTQKNKQEGILVSLDFQKAFDSLEWTFMLKALKAFNFGESFIKWIKLLYTNVSSCLINNGNTSGYFDVTRGVRQGDPMSSYLFIIAVETLSHAIRECKEIEGIKIGTNEIKLVQFADDTTPTLGSKKSIKPLLNLLKDFAKASGLIINTDKTEFLWLGKKALSTEQIRELPNPKTIIKLLGVYVSYDFDKMMRTNMETKLRDLSATLNLWRTRNLTIEGRILLAKSLGISKFNHITSVTLIPVEYKKRIESCLYNFIWKGGKDKIKRNTLIQDYKYGGLKMLDYDTIQRKISIQWMQKFLNTSISSPWKLILNQYIKITENPDLFPFSNYSENKLKESIPDFYKNVLKNWKSFYSHHNNYNTQVIWNNMLIKINNSSIKVNEFYNKGLITLADLYNPEGNARTFKYWVEKGIKPNMQFMYRQIIASTWHMRHSILRNDIDNPNVIKIGKKLVELKEIPSKFIYNFFLSKKYNQTKVKLIEKHSSVKEEINEVQNRIFILPRLCTGDKKLREFQFKLLHNILPTNKKLYKYKLKDTNTCDVCNTNPESIDHLLWECGTCKTIFLQFHEWWQKQTDTAYNDINLDTVLFGYFPLVKSNLSFLYNHLILITKYYIFNNKKHYISFNNLKLVFKETKKFEKTIAENNQNLVPFLKKWNKIIL